jgi:tagatose-6-phosphate ketose/aldose isomerase
LEKRGGSVVVCADKNSTMLGLSAAQLQQAGASWTAQEISQQPAIWQQLATEFTAIEASLRSWLQPLLALPNLRIIFTGAGTSAYIGQTVVPHLINKLPLPGQRIEAISTTDLVSHPQLYLTAETPTLLVSFGRSGNSPESVAALAVVDALVAQSFHLMISCNADGQLARFAKDKANCALWLLPDACHDRSFAMTSSFTGMLLATLLLFAPDVQAFQQATLLSEQVLLQHQSIRQLAQTPCRRIVFLGAGCLKGIAQEAALKYLELTSGQIGSYYESPLGFRHGPKSLVDGQTHIVLLKSCDAYSRLYDQDLRQELQANGRAQAITELDIADWATLPDSAMTDVWSAFPYIVYCQTLAFYKALQLGVTPDNPCPGGEVNRVVQGVTIYPLPETAAIARDVVLTAARGNR